MGFLSKLESPILRILATGPSSSNPSKAARWAYSAKYPVNNFHKTPTVNYPRMRPLPLPSNVEDIASTEKVRFSPLRSRDINGYLISGDKTKFSSDARVSCYDCSGSIKLNSAMQTNVPQPCKEQGLYTHFNMPNGLWRQSEKYIAADHLMTSTFLRHFSTQAPKENDNTPLKPTNPYEGLSRKEKLKTAVKEYGSVVIVFHVGISLISLGACYLAVTSGVDFSSWLNKIPQSDGAGAATAAAPFVVAYAIHKVFAPVRISITLVSVPFIVKYLRRIGFIKPKKSSSSEK